MTLNKHPDRLSGPRQDMSVAEAEAIAADEPDLIWLEVPEEVYYSAAPTSFEPER